MKNLLRELTIQGFLIYPQDKSFVVEKITEPCLEPKVFENYELAVEYAASVKKNKANFNIIVRYNRGLGAEFKTFKCFESTTLKEAEAESLKIIEKCFSKLDKCEIKEIKIREYIV